MASAFNTFVKGVQSIANPIQGAINLGSAAGKFVRKRIGETSGGYSSPGSNFVTQPKPTPSAPVGSSNPAATNPVPAPITTPTQSPSVLQSPAAQQFVQNQTAQGGSPSAPATPSPTGSGFTGNNGLPAPTERQDSAYITYLKTLFNPEQTRAAQKQAEAANKQLAEATQRYDEKEIEARRTREKLLDTPGMLKGGAEAAAARQGRIDTAELADLAVIKNSAAMSAGVYNDTYKTNLEAGKSLLEAEEAAMKAANDSVLSVEDAATLGVPYGTTIGMAQAQGIIPQVNKSPSEIYGSGSIGEYNFAVSQGYKGSFTDYQNEDANRKARAAGTGNGLTPYQTGQAFIGISNKYQADPIINVALKGATAVAIADQVLADPKAAANQLKSLYILVKNLDPDSAVREGEISLANQTQSYFQQFGNTLARVSEGRVISPDAAIQLANATKELATAWNTTAARRQQQYTAQAGVAGVGDQFQQYLSTGGGGFGVGENTGGGGSNPLGI